MINTFFKTEDKRQDKDYTDFTARNNETPNRSAKNGSFRRE